MKSLHVYQSCSILFLMQVPMCLWNFMIGSLDLLRIDLHDIMTCDAWSFLNSKSWRIFILKRKREAALIHAQLYQILSRAIHIDDIVWTHVATFYILSLIKHHCLLRLIIHPGTLVIHVHIHWTKSIKCGSQAALHPPERKRKRVTNFLLE
jgi:hypothetical protein